MSDSGFGGMVWNGVLIVALGFFIRLWIKNITDSLQNFYKENREEHKFIFNELVDHTKRIVVAETKIESLKKEQGV